MVSIFDPHDEADFAPALRSFICSIDGRLISISIIDVSAQSCCVPDESTMG